MTRIYLLLTVIMLLWGLNITAIKILVETINPVLLQGVRVMTAGLAVLFICKFLGILRLPGKAEWLTIFFISIFNVILHHSFIASGLEITSGVNASLIFGMSPIMTAFISFLILKERISWIRGFGFLLGFIGVIVTTMTGTGEVTGISLGDLFIFIGVFVQGLSFVLIGRIKSTLDARLVTGYMLVIGSIFIFLISLPMGADIQELKQLADIKLLSLFLSSALLATAFGHMIYNFYITKVGPVGTAIFINLETLFAATSAAVFLQETINSGHIIGFLLILFGVFLGTGALENHIKKQKIKYKQ